MGDLDFQLFDVRVQETLDVLDSTYDVKRMCLDETYQSNFPEENNGDDDDADPFAWSGSQTRTDRNQEPTPTIVCLFGKTREGLNIVARVEYSPYLRIEIPAVWGDRDIIGFLDNMAHKIRLPRDSLPYRREQRAHSYGWIPKSLKDGSAVATFPCILVRFPHEKAMRFAAAIIRKNPMYGSHPISVWEGRISTAMKFCDEQNLVPSGWIKIPQGAYRLTRACAAHADVEVEVADYRRIVPLTGAEGLAPFLIASFDIECYSKSRHFPVSDYDPIAGIGTSLRKFGEQQIEKHYFTWQPTQVTDPSIHLHIASSEEAMLHDWRDFLVIRNPDIVTGYNINGFDFRYIAERVKVLTRGEATRFFYFARFWAEHTPLETPEFSSSAVGDRVFFTFKMKGRLVLDMLESIRREYKLRSYKLDDVAQEYLVCTECRNGPTKAECKLCHGTGKYHKLDMPPQELFQLFEGSAEDRGRIAEYCVRDCDLVIELMTKLCTFSNLIAMSQVTVTLVQDIVSRGQQIRVYNQIVWYGHRDGYVINDPEDIVLGEDGYQGATVLEPQPGYYAEPIATLDFASLYPSIMLQHNLCFSTWVKDKRYQQVPGATYEHNNVGPRTYVFATNTMGILPKIIKTLLAARKAVRAEMARETDSFVKSLLNSKQLAIKTACNSVYGFCGTGAKGIYACLPVSDSTTYFGRTMITLLKRTIEAKYPGTVVVYGDTDSVMVKFALQGHPDPIRESFRLGAEVCVLAHEMFGENISLTMEKVFDGYILLRKKRYGGLMYEDPNGKAKMKLSGLEAVRRDYALMVCTTQEQVMGALLKERNVEKAMTIIQAKLQQLIKNEIPFEEYVLTFQMKKEYKNANQAQLVLLNRIKERAPGSEPKSGDRVQYVVLASKDKHAGRGEKVEDAAYAKEHNLPLDRLYYLEKQLERPLSDIMEAFVPNPKYYFDQARIQLCNQRDRMQDIRSLLGLPPAPVSKLAAPQSSVMVSVRKTLKPAAAKKDNPWKHKAANSKSKVPDKSQGTLDRFKPKPAPSQ